MISRFKSKVLALGALQVLSLFNAPVQVFAVEYWIGGKEPISSHERETSDYMQVFAPAAPWEDVASGVEAFKVSTPFILRVSDDDLKKLIDGLRERHIALAIELNVLVKTARCGHATRGYGDADTVETVCKRIQKFGGQIAYAEMTTPVGWGHIRHMPNCCQDSIESLVDQVAPKIEMLKSYFPKVHIGEEETLWTGVDELIPDMTKFIDLFREKTGSRLDFVNMDINWAGNWPPMLADLLHKLRQRHITTGVTIHGDGREPNDEWTRNALSRMDLVIADPLLTVDRFIFYSPLPSPTKMLPESENGTTTYTAERAMSVLAPSKKSGKKQL